MKYEKALTILTASAFGALISIGVTGCLISAFDLSVTSVQRLFLLCFFSGCLSAVCFSFRYGGILPGCLLALALGYVWREGTLAEQLLQLIHRISAIYDRAYRWGVLALTDSPWYAGSADVPMGLLGMLLSLLTAHCVCRRRSAALTIVLSLLPLLSCIVVTDTVPAEGYLLLVMAGLILLLLTSSVRQESGLQGLRLTSGIALPVILALILLFLAVPQKGYVNRSKELQQSILSTAQELPRKMDAAMNTLAARLRGSEPSRVDLSAVGPRIPQKQIVMEVTSEEGGVLYLRGQDYDGYTGLGWTAGQQRREVFSRGTVPAGTVTIETTDPKKICYVPYYPTTETVLTGGFLQNPDRSLRYTLSRGQLPENWRQTAYESTAADSPLPGQEYRQLPEITRTRALDYLEGFLRPDAGNTEKADIIAALVTDCAEYDLNTASMPAGEEDFALWFLREGDTGYCVHFATAAVVLLRAADVPARYVSGYLVETGAGHTVTVTEAEAHAWAEYYEPRLDAWLPLEVTPVQEHHRAPAPGIISPPVTETTEATEEPTLPATEPTVPSTETAPIPTETIPVGTETPEHPGGRIPRGWLLLPLALLLLAGQRKLRLHLHRKRLQTGSTNRQALARWQDAERLSRLLKEPPPEELLQLAQKAKFSPHILTEAELLSFDRYNRGCLGRLKEKPWYKGIVYRYIYALY